MFRTVIFAIFAAVAVAFAPATPRMVRANVQMNMGGKVR